VPVNTLVTFVLSERRCGRETLVVDCQIRHFPLDLAIRQEQTAIYGICLFSLSLVNLRSPPLGGNFAVRILLC
jgi:hypothetical protein